MLGTADDWIRKYNTNSKYWTIKHKLYDMDIANERSALVVYKSRIPNKFLLTLETGLELGRDLGEGWNLENFAYTWMTFFKFISFFSGGLYVDL